MSRMRFSIIIPAWNEAATIERAVRETAAVFVPIDPSAEIIVVDDGSSDGTAACVEQLAAEGMPVRVIRHASNQGKGAAVRTGALAAHGEWIVISDADISVSPDQIAQFIPALGQADILIGSRRVNGADIVVAQSVQRDYAGRLFNLIIRWTTGVPYHDTQCGFKVFHQRTKRLFEALETAGWAFDVELLVRARAAGLTVKEIPVIWRNGKESRVRWSDAWKIFKSILKIRRIE